MIMSWQCTLGAGTSKTEHLPEDLQDEFQRLNFLGHPEMTRFLSFCALRETYSDDPEVLPDALQHLIVDFQHALRQGIEVTYGGQKLCLRLACVCTKGDWPWLIEAGWLTRHFRRAAKRHEAQQPNQGICHYCCAGLPGVPCSDASSQAVWMRTMESAAAKVAWEDPSPLTCRTIQMKLPTSTDLTSSTTGTLASAKTLLHQCW